MTKRVKAGTYWRTISAASEIRVYKALYDGWSNMLVVFSYEDDLGTCVLSLKPDDINTRLYRCKKNGEWYGIKNGESTRTRAQEQNVKWLALAWQAKGALASLERVLYWTHIDIAYFDELKEQILAGIEAQRKSHVQHEQYLAKMRAERKMMP